MLDPLQQFIVQLTVHSIVQGFSQHYISKKINPILLIKRFINLISKWFKKIEDYRIDSINKNERSRKFKEREPVWDDLSLFEKKKVTLDDFIEVSKHQIILNKINDHNSRQFIKSKIIDDIRNGIINEDIIRKETGRLSGFVEKDARDSFSDIILIFPKEIYMNLKISDEYDIMYTISSPYNKEYYLKCDGNKYNKNELHLNIMGVYRDYLHTDLMFEFNK